MPILIIRCRHGIEYPVGLKGPNGAIVRTKRMLETCCCYVCYNRDCKESRAGKQECKNECELFTKNKYCER